MESDYSVAICLATYNGEKYLAEQLDSLLNQSYKNIKVYIHDDGSSDDTINIIREYVENDPDFFVFFDDDISYKNAGLNFMRTLEKIPKHDFYMFCDQDDVWLESKVLDTLKMGLMEAKSLEACPILVYTDLNLVDDNLNLLYSNLYRNLGYQKETINYERAVIACIAAGCTMLFNNKVRDLAFKKNYPATEKKMWHDYWLSLNALSENSCKLIYFNKPTLLYRQHSSNVVGYKPNKIISKKNIYLRLFLYAIDIVAIFKLYKNIKRVNPYIPRKISFFSAYVESVKMRYRRWS